METLISAEWIVERTQHRRFPFRITIRQGGREILAVRTQARWPGPGQQIFCLREETLDPDEYLEPVEHERVAHLGKVGRKITVAIDRGSRKRCEFLTVLKPGPDGTVREQIFFRTETGIRAHRSRARVELLHLPAGMTVVVDSNERYPWRFPGAQVKRRKLPVGDYALLDDERLVATVERKTFDNLLGDIGSIQALHHHLSQLSAQAGPVLVIEAQYGDFLNEKRLAGRWPAAHTSRVLAELAALHPGLPLVFAGNRKLANLWCERYFVACAAREDSPQLELVQETLAGYDPSDEPGIDERVRQAAIAFDAPFAMADLRARFPEVPTARLRRLLIQLRAEGVLLSSGRGRGTRWRSAQGAGRSAQGGPEPLSD